MSFDDVMFFFCELKPEKLAETIVRLKFLREMQGVRAASEAAWAFLACSFLAQYKWLSSSRWRCSSSEK